MCSQQESAERGSVPGQCGVLAAASPWLSTICQAMSRVLATHSLIKLNPPEGVLLPHFLEKETEFHRPRLIFISLIIRLTVTIHQGHHHSKYFIYH